MTVTSVQVETVHLTKRKTATDIVIAFSGALNFVDADNLANYHLAAPGKGKKSKTYNKLIHLNSAVYGRTPNGLTLQLNGKLSLSPASATSDHCREASTTPTAALWTATTTASQAATTWRS